MKQYLFKVRVPAPLVPSGRMKNQLITLNNMSKLHWATQKKAKDAFKNSLREWFFDENNGEPFDRLQIIIKPIRKNKKKLDAVNTAIAVKWLEDVLTDLGWVKDDSDNIIQLYPGLMEEGLNETLLEIEVYGVDYGGRNAT